MVVSGETVTVGDVEDFDDFCRRVHSRLVGALSLYCGDRTSAEDFAQEALARAYRDWARVGLLGTPEAWVHRVAMNLAHSWFRRLARGRRGTATPAPPHADDLDSGVAVRRAVAALPRRQREAIVLRYFLDWSVADTAAAMDCAEGTVRALTSQALTSLRADLGADLREDA